METLTKGHVIKRLRPLMDPDFGVSIVDMGLIVEIIIVGSNVSLDMTLTTHDCPYGPAIFSEVEERLATDPLINKFTLNLVWGEPRTLDDLSDIEKLDRGLDI